MPAFPNVASAETPGKLVDDKKLSENMSAIAKKRGQAAVSIGQITTEFISKSIKPAVPAEIPSALATPTTESATQDQRPRVKLPQ